MVDLHPRSNQPFVDPDTGDIICFNGEIYNYLEIKARLLKTGIKFRTESDTEVLLKFLQISGIEKLGEINGMYAFAYFNLAKNTITLARDELGKKPLYYYQDDSNFIWSSSLESVAHLAKTPTSDQGQNLQYLLLGYYLDPCTPYPEIRQLPPSQILTISFTNTELNSTNSVRESKYATCEKTNLREALKKAVETRCGGQDSIAISLSGGVDSAIIAILASELELNCVSYSAHWSDSDKNRYNTDSVLAKKISEKLGFKHVVVEMLNSQNLEEELDNYLDAMEEPNSNPSGVSMMRLYNAIKNDGHRLALTGDGADEIFSGYERYEKVSKIPNVCRIRNLAFQNLIMGNRNKYNAKLLGLLASQINPDVPTSWLYWHSIFTPSELSKLAPEWAKKETLHSEFTSKFLDLTLDNVDINVPSLLMSKDFQVWLPMESNRRLDRISMYHSIEARSPFQDRDVVAVARRLMQESKYRILNKQILKEAFPELDDLGVRPDKAGFISPLGHWLRSNPELVERTLQYLENELKWSPGELSKYYNAPQRGNFRELVQLWNLIVFTKWCQKWK